MKRKRLISMVAVLALTMSVLSACGSKDNASSGNESTSSGDKVDITVWLTPQWKGVLNASEQGADYDSFFKKAAEKFTAQYTKYKTNVKVEVIAADQRDQLLNVNLSGGTPPDVFFESIFPMGDYVHRGALVPLDDIVDDKSKTDIAKSYWDAATFGDKVYFYPFQHNPGTLVYNADMFKAAGLEKYLGGANEIKTWTWAEYQEILDGLKNKLPKDKYPNAYPMALYGVNNQGDTWNLAYLRTFGNKFFDDKGNIILDDANGVKAASWLKKLYDGGYTNPGAESVSSNDANAMFQNQQLGISFTNPVLFTNSKVNMDKGTSPKFDMRLANIPSESGDPLAFTYVVGASVFQSKDPKKVEVAKDFVKFFSSDPELVKSSKNGIPVRSSVVDALKGENPLFAAYDADAKYMFNFTGNVPGYSQLREVLYPELQALYTGAKTPEQVVKDYQTNGNKVIEDNKKNSVIFNP
ncbi:multiple sugar transport system substrate-binding protein [Paenibacillus shirakamiensis]|uniref:Multiple sugar transport system substrate-binding protein n=1 Tax=Paenibacillus shirakamiensis TaxID=1265935 RepID=A0ABS4JKC5_9BACL|nr:extracellular solute-binding protein [Paenibacillus shirakamiensis]MBP2002162.1 multiple sugar transport system substrate-binding protein [Paenibacillus shirakamiensis]